MVNWFVFGVIVGIILIAYLFVSIKGIGYLFDLIFRVHKAEQIMFMQLYKKHFNNDVIDSELGYNNKQERELYGNLLSLIEAQYKNMTLQERYVERERLQSKLEVMSNYTQRGFWTLTIIIGTITLYTLITIGFVTRNRPISYTFMLPHIISWGIKVLAVLYIAWIIETIINERRILRQSMQIAFYKVCLHSLYRIQNE